jgi:hypothetical protein
MTDIAFAEGKAAAFLRRLSRRKLLCPRRRGQRGNEHRRKNCERPAAHAGILPHRRIPALIWVNSLPVFGIKNVANSPAFGMISINALGGPPGPADAHGRSGNQPSPVFLLALSSIALSPRRRA